MDDIARQIGISKKTIYQHFTDKDDIVYQVTSYRLEKDKERVDCHIAEAVDPVEGMLKVSEMMREMMGNINPSLLIDIQRYHPRAWQVYTDFRDKHVLESVRVNLRNGIDRGYYRPDLDIETLARLRVESVQLGFNPQLFPHKNLFNVQMQLLHHFIRGILTEKGFELYNYYQTTQSDEVTKFV